jgi:hypothetical protein
MAKLSASFGEINAFMALTYPLSIFLSAVNTLKLESS